MSTATQYATNRNISYAFWSRFFPVTDLVPVEKNKALAATSTVRSLILKFGRKKSSVVDHACALTYVSKDVRLAFVYVNQVTSFPTRMMIG